MKTKLQQPALQQILGEQWTHLPAVIRKHYALRCGSTDCITVEGEMETVHHSLMAKLLLPMGRLMGSVVPYRGKQVPVRVHCRSVASDASLVWDRVFCFTGRRPFHLRSKMVPTRAHQVVEYVRFGMGMRLRVTVEDGVLVFRDDGYLWRVGPVHIPLPGRWLFGRAYIEERAVDERCFSMRMELRHAWFGVLFAFQGVFALPCDPAFRHGAKQV